MRCCGDQQIGESASGRSSFADDPGHDQSVAADRGSAEWDRFQRRFNLLQPILPFRRFTASVARCGPAVSSAGRSSATGSPCRVTMKVSPAVTASITFAFSLRSSRCAIVLAGFTTNRRAGRPLSSQPAPAVRRAAAVRATQRCWPWTPGTPVASYRVRRPHTGGGSDLPAVAQSRRQAAHGEQDAPLHQLVVIARAIPAQQFDLQVVQRFQVREAVEHRARQ